MARFIQPPQQQIISMYTPENIDFYANILNKAQSDLERATETKAAAIDKYNELPFYSDEDRKATLGRVQEMLKGTLDEDFVSPSKVASAVMKANQEVMPGVHALKAKASAAEQYDKLRMAYGANAWLGVDPRQQSIIDPNTGRFVDPSRFKAVGINAEDVDKTFLASQLSNLTESFDRTVPSDLFGYHKIEKVTGLDDAQREETYAPGTSTAIQIAKAQLESMPQLKEIFGSEEEALKRLMVRNYQTSGNYKQSVDSQYITNRGVLDAEARARLGAETTTRPTIFQPIEGDVGQNSFISDALTYLAGSTGTTMSAKDISFDESGKLAVQSAPGKVAIVNPYGQIDGYKDPSKQSQIVAYSKNIAQNKLLTGMRNSLREQGLSTVVDPATNRPRARTDKEVYEFYTSAINNSANIFGKNFEVTPGIEIASSNPFVDSQGRFKDFRNSNIEMFVDGEWKSIDKDDLAETMGFDLSNSKNVTAFSGALKDISSRVLDFSTGKAKQRASINTTEGNLSLRFNAPPKVTQLKRPVAELVSAFYAPTKKEVTLGGDFKAIVESSIVIDAEGKPILMPEIKGFTGGTPELVDAYWRLYLQGESYGTGQGYQAIIDDMMEQTDNTLLQSGAVVKQNSYKLPE